MEITHLNQYDLAKRWRMSQRTLERWRWQGIGPTYLKLGMRIVYRIADIEAFEQKGEHHADQLPASTPMAGAQ